MKFKIMKILKKNYLKENANKRIRIRFYLDGTQVAERKAEGKEFCPNVDEIFLGYTSACSEAAASTATTQNTRDQQQIPALYSGSIRNFIYQEFASKDKEYEFIEFFARERKKDVTAEEGGQIQAQTPGSAEPVPPRVRSW